MSSKTIPVLLQFQSDWSAFWANREEIVVNIWNCDFRPKPWGITETIFTFWLHASSHFLFSLLSLFPLVNSNSHLPQFDSAQECMREESNEQQNGLNVQVTGSGWVWSHRIFTKIGAKWDSRGLWALEQVKMLWFKNPGDYNEIKIAFSETVNFLRASYDEHFAGKGNISLPMAKTGNRLVPQLSVPFSRLIWEQIDE